MNNRWKNEDYAIVWRAVRWYNRMATRSPCGCLLSYKQFSCKVPTIDNNKVERDAF